MSLNESEKSWVVARGADVFGPVSAIEIKMALRDASSAPTHFWRRGWTAWKSAHEIPLFKSELKGSVMPPKESELPVPDSDSFEATIVPLLSAKDLRVEDSAWDCRRMMWVAGAYAFAGPLGGVVAVLATKGGAEERAQARRLTESQQSRLDEVYINDKNK